MPAHMRDITKHIVDNQVSKAIVALHRLEDKAPNEYRVGLDVVLKFQTKPGGDGLTNEILLAILLDRLEYLNEAVPCLENVGALHHVRSALDLLKSRTRDRIERKVEGTNEP